MNDRLNNIQLWIGRFIAFDLDLIAIMFGLGGVQFLPFTLFFFTIARAVSQLDR